MYKRIFPCGLSCSSHDLAMEHNQTEWISRTVVCPRCVVIHHDVTILCFLKKTWVGEYQKIVFNCNVLDNLRNHDVIGSRMLPKKTSNNKGNHRRCNDDYKVTTILNLILKVLSIIINYCLSYQREYNLTVLWYILKCLTLCSAYVFSPTCLTVISPACSLSLMFGQYWTHLFCKHFILSY